MVGNYPEDELLALSGIQHYVFCKRQWGLIHIEKQWAENVKTIEGRFLHDKVDNGDPQEKRLDKITMRSVNIQSHRLGLFGVADVVEYVKSKNNEGVSLVGREGLWIPKVIEFKRGKPKKDNCDLVQLCAQAICIEEMSNIFIDRGYIFYGETRHRAEVIFDMKLRDDVFAFAEEMHKDFKNGLIHQPVNDWRCKNCSLNEICMPSKQRTKSVKSYIDNYID
jgi:CRISPR-associated exonuclease Cas4